MRAAGQWAACVAMVALAAAGCSSSSSGGEASDGGDAASSYGPPPSDGSADGESGQGDGGPDGPTCNVPAAATFSTMYMGATMGCSPQVPNGQCDSMSYRLECMATDNPSNVPPTPTSLMCNLLPNGNNPLVLFYCCPCN